MSIKLINTIFPTWPECTISVKTEVYFGLFSPLNYNSWLVFGPHSYCFSEMAPVCAVVGGVLGQEIVKVRSLIWSIYMSEVFIFFFVLLIHEMWNVFSSFAFPLPYNLSVWFSTQPWNPPFSLAAKVTFLMRRSETLMAAALSIRIWAKSKSFICWRCVNARNDEVIFRSLMKSSGESLKSSHMIP